MPKLSISYGQMIESKRWLSVFSLFWFVGVWLLSRPFYGIWGDGMLYTVQAMKHLDPAVFKRDLYFMFGSQDSFTPYSSIYASMIDILGVQPAALLIVSSGAALWLTAVWYLSSILGRNWIRLTSLLFAVAYLPFYCGLNTFGYGEALTTPRIFAEAFVLFSLGLKLKGRVWLAWVCALLAAVMHPLIALPGLVVLFLISVKNWRQGILISLAGLVLSLVLAVLRIGPFQGLLEVMDKPWYQFLQLRSAFLFVQSWPWIYLSSYFFDFALLAAGWWYGPEPYRRLYFSAFLTGASGLLVSWLVGAYWPNVLLMGLQLWRALWVAQFIGVLFFVPLAHKLWGDGFWGRFLVAGLISAYLLRAEMMGVVAWLSLLAYFAGRRFYPNPRLSRTTLFFLALVPLQVIFWWAMGLKSELILNGNLMYRSSWSFGVTHMVLMAILVGLLMLSSACFGSRSRNVLLAVMATGYLVAGLFLFDDRSPKAWPYDKPNYVSAIAPVQQHIPPGATVYWEFQPYEVWYGLRRANYISQAQNSGAVFYREIGVVSLKRVDHVLKSGFLDTALVNFKHSDKDFVRWHIKPNLERLCSDPALDYVITSDRLSGKYELTFKTPRVKRLHYLYNCKTIRADSVEADPEVGKRTDVSPAKRLG